MDLAVMSIIFFFVGSIVNVILATIKSIVTARSDNKFIVSSANAISFGFYAIIIQQMVHYSTEITVMVTLFSNFIGVTASMFLIDLIKKDRVWKISVTCLANEEEEALMSEIEETNLSYSHYEINSRHSTLMGFDIYSHTKKESDIAKEILSRYTVKYHVLEVKSEL